jgi:hypothetical protein
MKTRQKTAAVAAPPASPVQAAPVILPPAAIPETTAPPASNGNGAPPAVSPAIAPVKARTAAAAVESVESATSMAAAFKYWFMHDAPTWLASAVIHMVLFLAAALILGTISYEKNNDVAKFESAETDDWDTPPIERFEVGDPQIETSELTTDSLMETTYDPVPQEAEFNDNSAEFEKRGGGTVSTSDASLGGLGLNIQATGLGPVARGGGGLDGGGGFGNNVGRGGDGMGFGGRGAGKRDAIAGGGTKQTERAVAGALNWLARHQNPDGSWSIDHNTARCQGKRCSGGGREKATSGATALGLLPFFAAGQTHLTKGPYKDNIYKGLYYLLKVQKPNGDLSNGGNRQMYEHGLAAIALCEAYGMSKDERIGYSAQAAVNFIQNAQNGKGGWRYTAGTPETDTSVVGWQVMALKSGQMAGLEVNPVVLEKAKRGLDEAATGEYKGQYGYQPGRPATPAMTGVGLLCMQYMGTSRDDKGMRDGIDYLLKHLPTKDTKNIYYYYYATQVMHNVPGEQWETWNRKMRRVLVESQERSGCAEGSWNPEGDEWGDAGGRLMVTSLSCLTLEVYYRYLPLYKLNKEDDLDKPATEMKAEMAEAKPAKT